MTIIHLLEVQACNGAYTMLEELHWAISKYHPDCQQKVFVCGDPRRNRDFYLPSEYLQFSQLKGECRKPDRPVVFLHKLMRTNVSDYSEHLYKRVPLVVVNHTFTKKIEGMGDCDKVVSVSEKMMRTLSDKFPTLSHAFIRNGVNQERYEAVAPRTDPGIEENYFLTGRINALNNHKYSDEFLKWLSDAKWPRPVMHEYIGNGNYLKQARRLAKRLSRTSNNRIRIIGPVYVFKRKIPILKSWNAFLYAINRHEGTSMSILESLACGVPVICSNHAGNKEIIEQGVNGYVFKDYDRATRWLTHLMEHPHVLSNLKRSTAQHFAEKLDARFMAKNYVELADSLLSKA